VRILVTGVTGFVGGHLVRAWKKRLPGAEIFGLARGKSCPELGGDKDRMVPAANLLCLDLRQADAVREACQKVAPDWIVHLAAQSFVPGAFASPRETWEINFWGTFHLLEALRESGFAGRLLFVGSGEPYGKVKAEDLPIGETQPFRPRNPYAASKAAAELLCYQYSQSYGLDVVLARPFNHIGPGQSPRFVVSDFSRQVARIELGLQEPVLYVGNLAVSRDFLDVRDVVTAYLCLLERGRGGEAYNVCSGQEVRLAELVRSIVGFSSRRIEIRVDRTRIRPTDTPRFSGSHEKLTQHTSWRPRRDILTTLREVFAYWKEELER
jgi:GDP-4-dehydro-6-deoxy-D-mannose reductase